jgi:aspartyl-tRNA(Asn)/glutamyl-tRNA(Gln) amidotransferase subunit C
MKIDDVLISKLETLSRLKLEASEKEVLKLELGSIVDMFKKIADIDTTGVQPLRHMTDVVNVWREDEAANGLTTEQGLKNAPLKEGPFFVVPKVIE